MYQCLLLQRAFLFVNKQFFSWHRRLCHSLVRSVFIATVAFSYNHPGLTVPRLTETISPYNLHLSNIDFYTSHSLRTQ